MPYRPEPRSTPPMGDEQRHDAARDVSSHVRDGIDAVGAIYERAQHDLSSHQRTVEAFSYALSRPAAVYVARGGALLWICFNLLARTMGYRQLDKPPFYYLQGVVCLAALVTALVLAAAQRRQGSLAEQRAHLDLQVNLLAERKLAKLISLVEELRRDSPQVRNRKDPEADAMSVPADPDMVVRALDEERRVGTDK